MKTILLLEDETPVMKLMASILKGYKLLQASSAEQALMLFIDQDYKIDLLVSDLSLPTSSGIQVARIIRSKAPYVPVVLTSGYPVSGWNKGDLADLERLGPKSIAILQKPFDPRALSSTVAEFLEPSEAATAARPM